MVNWYYVVGSERVGPVSESALRVMFMNNQISLDTYVWRKGFQNWERLKDVGELDFENQSQSQDSEVEEDDIKLEELSFKTITKNAPVETSSPEVDFIFDWKKVRQDDELFFIKIGKDRKKVDESDIYGPYSMVELKEAIEQKRINMQTLIFAAGMDYWTKIQETVLNPHSNALTNNSISLNEAPLMLVFDYSPLPLVTLVKKAGTKEGILLGAGPFSEFASGTHKVSLYVGNELRAKNVTVKINSYDKIAQTMDCQFLDLNQDARKIMLNHAV